MSLVDYIEELGEQVESGTLDKDTAVQRLVEFSEGGLTKLGAEDSLANWRTRRQEYTAIFDNAQRQLNELQAAETGSEIDQLAAKHNVYITPEMRRELIDWSLSQINEEGE